MEDSGPYFLVCSALQQILFRCCKRLRGCRLEFVWEEELSNLEVEVLHMRVCTFLDIIILMNTNTLLYIILISFT